jgi:uncharacterized protein YPO0396
MNSLAAVSVDHSYQSTWRQTATQLDAMDRRVGRLHDRIEKIASDADCRVEATRASLESRLERLQDELRRADGTIANLKVWALSRDIMFASVLFYFIARGLRWI